MKAIILYLALALMAGCSGDSDESTAAQPQVTINTVNPAIDAADATFQDLQGNPLELSDFTGQRVFLNYWATWCGPCIEEIPAIIRAETELAPEGFVFLLASDESLEVIGDFVADYGFDANFIKLNSFFGAYGVQAMPSTVLYDSSGEMVDSWLGAYEWDSPEMLAKLRQAQ
ncbi:MAG: TlpA disulfide reductase family protein [Pseudohongiellaceae bacterium]